MTIKIHVTYFHEGLEISHRILPPRDLDLPYCHFEPRQFGNGILNLVNSRGDFMELTNV